MVGGVTGLATTGTGKAGTTILGAATTGAVTTGGEVVTTGAFGAVTTGAVTTGTGAVTTGFTTGAVGSGATAGGAGFIAVETAGVGMGDGSITAIVGTVEVARVGGFGAFTDGATEVGSTTLDVGTGGEAGLASAIAVPDAGFVEATLEIDAGVATVVTDPLLADVLAGATLVAAFWDDDDVAAVIDAMAVAVVGEDVEFAVATGADVAVGVVAMTAVVEWSGVAPVSAVVGTDRPVSVVDVFVVLVDSADESVGTETVINSGAAIVTAGVEVGTEVVVGSGRGAVETASMGAIGTAPPGATLDEGEAETAGDFEVFMPAEAVIADDAIVDAFASTDVLARVAVELTADGAVGAVADCVAVVVTAVAGLGEFAAVTAALVDEGLVEETVPLAAGLPTTVAVVVAGAKFSIAPELPVMALAGDFAGADATGDVLVSADPVARLVLTVATDVSVGVTAAWVVVVDVVGVATLVELDVVVTAFVAEPALLLVEPALELAPPLEAGADEPLTDAVPVVVPTDADGLALLVVVEFAGALVEVLAVVEEGAVVVPDEVADEEPVVLDVDLLALVEAVVLEELFDAVPLAEPVPELAVPDPEVPPLAPEELPELVELGVAVADLLCVPEELELFEPELSAGFACAPPVVAVAVGLANVTTAAALIATCACCSMRVRTGAGRDVVFTRGGTAPIGTRWTRTSIV